MIPPFPYPPGPAAPTMPAPSRFVTRYGVEYCPVCGFPAANCPGHVPTPVEPESNLNKRIAEARTKTGAR